jgi:hypothetical protein
MSYVFYRLLQDFQIGDIPICRLCDVENDKTIKLCEFGKSKTLLKNIQERSLIDSFEEKTRIRAPGAPGHVIPILMATRILGFNPFQSLVS